MRSDRANPLPHRARLICSVVLIALAILCTLAWVHSIFRGYAMNVYTEVMQTPAGGYTSHQRAIATSRGRLWFAYVRADPVAKSARYEKRVRWYGSALPPDEEASRYNAPAWLAMLGVDWRGKGNSRVDPQEGL